MLDVNEVVGFVPIASESAWRRDLVSPAGGVDLPEVSTRRSRQPAAETDRGARSWRPGRGGTGMVLASPVNSVARALAQVTAGYAEAVTDGHSGDHTADLIDNVSVTGSATFDRGHRAETLQCRATRLVERLGGSIAVSNLPRGGEIPRDAETGCDSGTEGSLGLSGGHRWKSESLNQEPHAHSGSGDRSARARAHGDRGTGRPSGSGSHRV